MLEQRHGPLAGNAGQLLELGDAERGPPREVSGEHTVGYWKFEADPGQYKDSSKRGGDITETQVQSAPVDTSFAALVDFCHVLLNTNEFLYVD